MDIDALAALAANTVVAAAVTDAFEGLRAKVARVFGRDKPDPGTQRRLDATRRQLTAATGAGPGGNVTNTISGTVRGGPVLMAVTSATSR
jgi:hypothetical protein